MAKFEVYKSTSKEGGFCWRMRDEEGEIVACGRTCRTEADCKNEIAFIKSTARKAEVVVAGCRLKNFVPMKLNASIRGDLGTTNRIEWDGEKLFYSSIGRGFETAADNEKVEVIVKEADWEQFRAMLDVIDIWKWRERYGPPDLVRDGMSWVVEVVCPDKSTESSGCHESPEGFRRFFAAVSVLAKGKEFSL